MITRLVLLAATSVFYASATLAAPVTIDVRGADARPLAGAVVAVEAPGVAAPQPRGVYSVEQRQIQFEPHVVIVPVGATVGFPNRDKVRHHVYSFSTPKKFDLKLYGREEARTVTFDKPGVVALGCNIHDAMSGLSSSRRRRSRHRPTARAARCCRACPLDRRRCGSGIRRSAHRVTC